MITSIARRAAIAFVRAQIFVVCATNPDTRLSPLRFDRTMIAMPSGHPFRPPRRVALMVTAPSGFGQKLLEGIAGFQPHGVRWSIDVLQRPAKELVERLGAWRGDGVLATIGTPEMATAAAQLACPVVNMAGRLDDLPLPSVLGDERAIGRAAAADLLDRGFDRFAFVGSEHAFAVSRGDGFAHAVIDAGHPPPDRFIDGLGDAAVASWLTEVKHPAAVFTQDDYAGHGVLNLCLRLGGAGARGGGGAGGQRPLVAVRAVRPAAVERGCQRHPTRSRSCRAA